jgi:hypothetical protein
MFINKLLKVIFPLFIGSHVSALNKSSIPTSINLFINTEVNDTPVVSEENSTSTTVKEQVKIHSISQNPVYINRIVFVTLFIIFIVLSTLVEINHIVESNKSKSKETPADKQTKSEEKVVINEEKVVINEEKVVINALQMLSAKSDKSDESDDWKFTRALKTKVELGMAREFSSIISQQPKETAEHLYKYIFTRDGFNIFSEQCLKHVYRRLDFFLIDENIDISKISSTEELAKLTLIKIQEPQIKPKYFQMLREQVQADFNSRVTKELESVDYYLEYALDNDMDSRTAEACIKSKFVTQITRMHDYFAILKAIHQEAKTHEFSSRTIITKSPWSFEPKDKPLWITELKNRDKTPKPSVDIVEPNKQVNTTTKPDQNKQVDKQVDTNKADTNKVDTNKLDNNKVDTNKVDTKKPTRTSKKATSKKDNLDKDKSDKPK